MYSARRTKLKQQNTTQGRFSALQTSVPLEITEHYIYLYQSINLPNYCLSVCLFIYLSIYLSTFVTTTQNSRRAFIYFFFKHFRNNIQQHCLFIHSNQVFFECDGRGSSLGEGLLWLQRTWTDRE